MRLWSSPLPVSCPGTGSPLSALRHTVPLAWDPRALQAIHGGTATHDTIDAQNMAVLLRGGRLPPASVSPADMRARRDLRRIHLGRQRAARCTPVPHPNRPDNVPALGQDSADTTNRPGGAARVAAPAVHTSVAVALALRDEDDQLRHDLEVASGQTAQPQDAPTVAWLQTVPGRGKRLRRVRVEASPASARVSRGQDGVASCRLGPCAKASAGTRKGPAGTPRGNAALQGALSDAAVLGLRHTPGGQKYWARLATKHGQGKALTLVAHTRARARAARVPRRGAGALDACLQGEGRRAGRLPGSPWVEPAHRARPSGTAGVAARACAQRPVALPLRVCWAACARSCPESARPGRGTGGCPAPAPAPP